MVALVGLLSGMDPQVLLQGGILGKSLSTTFEGTKKDKDSFKSLLIPFLELFINPTADSNREVFSLRVGLDILALHWSLLLAVDLVESGVGLWGVHKNGGRCLNFLLNYILFHDLTV